MAGHPAGGPSSACATSPGASAICRASSTSIACSCAIPSPDGRCSIAADAGVVPARRRPHRVGQRRLRQGRRGQQRERSARAPDRAAGNAPARGRQGCAGQGRSLPRARPHHQRRRAQGARCGGAAARRRHGRRRHRRCRAGDGAGRAEPPRGGLRAHAGPRGDGSRHLRSRPAPGVLQRGLSQAVAVRHRLAGDQADRCAAARSAARAVAPSRSRQLPRLEGQDPLELQDRRRVRGLVASARWPHHSRRRPRSAPTAASPISTPTSPNASPWRAATTPSSMRSAKRSTA